MTRLNHSNLRFFGVVISLGATSFIGCGLDTHGLPSETTSTGSSGMTGGNGGSGGEGGTGNTGGMSGVGGGMVCVPDATMSCYSGPISTANVGACKTGTQTCLANGTGYGPCMGEIVPMLENCVTMGDEDCDGFADISDPECKCTTPGDSVACDTGKLGVCAAGTGLCAADGRSVDTCTQTVMAAEAENCATAEDDDCDGTAVSTCTGELQWSYTSAGAATGSNDDSIYSVALAPDGGYVIAGLVDGALSGDGYNLATTPLGSAYVAKLDANGMKLWEKKYSAMNYAVARGVAVDKQGNVLVTGAFMGDMTLEMDSYSSTSPDIFVVKLDAMGNKVWTRAITTTGTQIAYAIAVDDAGNYFLTGTSDDVVNFGNGNSSAATGVDFFVASYAADNSSRWGKLFNGAGNQYGRGIAINSGDVVVTGDTNDNTNLGGATMNKDKSVDIFVARYANADGAYGWGKLYGKGADQFPRGIATARNGDILITGGFAGTIDWGGGLMMTAMDTSDVFVARLNPTNGAHLAHADGGNTGTSVGNAIGEDASGNVTVFGHFNGSIKFGAQSVMSSPGSYDTFLVKLQATLANPFFTQTYGTMGQQYGWSTAVKPDGSAIVGGGFYMALVVSANVTLPNTGGSDLYGILVKP